MRVLNLPPIATKRSIEVPISGSSWSLGDQRQRHEGNQCRHNNAQEPTEESHCVSLIAIARLVSSANCSSVKNPAAHEYIAPLK